VVVVAVRLAGSAAVLALRFVGGVGSVIVDRDEPGLVSDEVDVVLWGILRQFPPVRSNPSGQRCASSFLRFSTASRVEVVDCWVVVWVTSLRDWLDSAAVESAPVLPFVQKPPFRAIPGWPGPADVGQKIWASTLDENPNINSGTTATPPAASLRYWQKPPGFTALPPTPNSHRNRFKVPNAASDVCNWSTTLKINRSLEAEDGEKRVAKAS
jgi:hypothetical protein